ncbi:MAG: hypothetical protein AB9869_18400 [Verrucomicrobiia bacterium]
MERQLSTSVPFIGAPAVWSSALGADGRGVRIGIIDSGIDYTHANFGGSPASSIELWFNYGSAMV